MVISRLTSFYSQYRFIFTPNFRTSEFDYKDPKELSSYMLFQLQELLNTPYFTIQDGKFPFLTDLENLLTDLFLLDNKELFDDKNDLIDEKWLAIKPKFVLLIDIINLLSFIIHFFFPYRNNNQEEIDTFFILLSRSFANRLKDELNQGEIDHFIYISLKTFGSNNLLNLQVYDPEMWLDAHNLLVNLETIKLRPLLHRTIYREVAASLRNDSEVELLKQVLSPYIDKDQIINNCPEVFKPKENKALFNLIKDLFSELREGDEVTLQTTVEVIKEQFNPVFTKDDEIETILKNLILNSPDFEYVRLKRSFRRKNTTLDQMISNLDKLFLEKGKIK